MIMAACYMTCSSGSDIGRGIHRRMPHCRVVSDGVFFDAPTRPSTAYSRVMFFLSFLVLCVGDMRWKQGTVRCVGESIKSLGRRNNTASRDVLCGSVKHPWNNWTLFPQPLLVSRTNTSDSFRSPVWPLSVSFSTPCSIAELCATATLPGNRWTSHFSTQPPPSLSRHSVRHWAKNSPRKPSCIMSCLRILTAAGGSGGRACDFFRFASTLTARSVSLSRANTTYTQLDIDQGEPGRHSSLRKMWCWLSQSGHGNMG